MSGGRECGSRRRRAGWLSMLFAGLLALGVQLPGAASAEPLALQCRRLCADEIAACVEAGESRRPCRRRLIRACKRDGVVVCVSPGESPADARGARLSTGLTAPGSLRAT